MTYEPVDCSFHDRLESFAVRGTRCRIRYHEPDGRERDVVTRIADVFTRGGEEFAELDEVGLVRLDRLVAVTGEEGGEGSAAD